MTDSPENPDDLILQAIATAAQGHWAAAEPLVRRALALAPGRVDILARGADFFAATDALSEAIALYDQALERHPQDADLWRRAAAARESLHDLEGAESACRRALALQPEDAETWTHLGELLRQRNRRDEALIAQRRALSLAPQSSQAWQNLAMLLVDLALLDDAVAAFDTALKFQPDATLALSNLLFSMGFTQHWPAATLRARAMGWEQIALSEAERQAARMPFFNRPPAHQRRLRLGVLSSEFGHHAVGFFLWPWLRALDPERCELFLYPTRLRPEPEAEAFKTLTEHWTPLVSLTDAQAAERIRADQIDVLVETSGHTKHHRLGIVARRVAPVQCHYIGYFSTTGLSHMDYLIGDPVFTPPEWDGDFVEQVWRLPRSRYAFQPIAQAPEPAWRPDPQGRLWLASFNQLNKVREASLELWSRILHAQPNARLLLKDDQAEDSVVQARILATLAQRGISAERVKFVGRTALWSEHLGLYNYVDLALDPIPFTSATTGFEALWMGTPLVTLMGESPAARQAASLLTGLGRPQWIAQTADDYVRIALALLDDVAQRRHIRLTQRAAMRESELCDGAGLAAVLLDTFEQMFEQKTIATLYDHRQLGEALAACDAALQSHPDWISVQHTRAIVLRDLWRLDDALAACETVLRLQPKWVDAQMLRGNLLTKLGRADEAVATYRLVMQLRPEHAPAHTNYLMALHYREPTAEGAILAAARDFGRHFDRPELRPTHSNPRIPQRRLRIGYVSGDFCHHPVAYFLLGVLAHHDRTAVEVHGYKTQTRRDDFTDRLEACVEHWTTLTGLDDEAAAAQIRADGIDILVDLSGHTAGNRLLMFARRPAPVQVTWIGYSGTTGLATMDYILADRHVVPEHQAHNFTEQVWRLPNSYLCFTPLDECSEIQPSTAATTAVVFGSFNNLAKLSPQTVVLWATLLHRVPDSQLILKHPALSQQRVRREVLSRFAAQGVDFGRLQLLGFTTRAEHFALYQRMDIALDPTPYGGTTTTAEALWMGKPVVTLSGETWVARVGESILTTLGLPELIARTEDDYLAIGASLAADVERRTWLTNNLRRILSESPFGDAAGFTRDLEAAYRGMWRRYCDTKNPQL